MSYRSSRCLCAVVAILSLIACFHDASAQDIVRINGTGSGVALLTPLISAFQREHKNIGFDMERSLGSSASIKAVAKSALDIAVSGRPLKPAESPELLAIFEYGKTPFAVVSNRQTRIDNITVKELAAMYAGKSPRWSNGGYVRVVLRPNEDTDTRILRAISPEMDQAVTAAQARKDMLLGITDQEAFELVMKTEGAIGFMALSIPLSEPGFVNVSRLDGVQPSVRNLAAGKYPYAKSIFVVTRKDSSPAVNKFLKFLNSKKGRAIAARYGLLPATK